MATLLRNQLLTSRLSRTLLCPCIIIVHPRKSLYTVEQRRARRSGLCAAAEERNPSSSSNGDAQPTGPDQEVVRENVENATKMLNQMLEEIMNEMFVEQAASYITDEQPELEESQAVTNAVVQRIDFLDANFLAALNAYIKAASTQQDPSLAQLLVMIRDEVLRQVAQRLPAAARVLNRVLQEEDKDVRVNLLRSSMAGGQGDLPGADTSSLAATATQFIDDMEEQQLVADRQLLARLCLVREEVRWLEMEAGFGPDSNPALDAASAALFTRSNVPQRCIAFLKEVIAVNEPTTRVGLLNKALREDWEGAAPRQKPQRGQTDNEPDYVRPGRLLGTLHSTVAKLQVDSERNAKVLKRLADVHIEIMAVLDALQRGEQQPATMAR